MGDRKSRSDRQGGDKSQRQLKVGEEIRHLVSDILLRHPFYEPELDGVSVTVSEVSISPDFANARVYVMPLGGIDPDGVIEALGRIAKTVQHELSRRLTIRRTPKLRFILDSSFDTASRINALIGENSDAIDRK